MILICFQARYIVIITIIVLDIIDTRVGTILYVICIIIIPLVSDYLNSLRLFKNQNICNINYYQSALINSPTTVFFFVCLQNLILNNLRFNRSFLYFSNSLIRIYRNLLENSLINFFQISKLSQIAFSSLKSHCFSLKFLELVFN